jgi:SSS family transporter
MVASHNLHLWGWCFLALYVCIMIGAGIVGMRNVRNSDDFATARKSYGPWFLAFAVVATTASGATFLGIPGIVYSDGISGLWYAFVYPFGVYSGLVICAKVIARAGEEFGTRTIPEYLGHRYESEFLRIASSIFSLLLLFYLAAQLLSGSVMFQQILGVPEFYGLTFTSGILLLYVVLGGAHSDILTDGVQGTIMVAIALVVIWLFLSNFGIDPDSGGIIGRLRTMDANSVRLFNPASIVVGGWWAVFCIWFSHIPLGMLPHIGNKVWALDTPANRNKFLTITFILGLILPALALGGLSARAILGDVLAAEGQSPNNAIPALFVAVLPTWLAAFLGTGILCAVMSTADGLAVAASQIFANDIYRCTLAKGMSAEHVDRVALRISRASTIVILVLSVAMAWALRRTNIAIAVWLGIGGMTAALTGPMLLGAIWPRVTRIAAIAGFSLGALVFAGASTVAVFIGYGAITLGAWDVQFLNPFIRATYGGIVSAVATAVVSLLSSPPPLGHIVAIFGERPRQIPK